MFAMEPKIKAIFFDIDGTLVRNGLTEPDPEVIESLSRVRRNGVKIFIASGRHMEWIVNLGSLKVDGYVTTNGSMCVGPDGKDVFYCNPIAGDDIDRLIDFSHHHDMPFVVVPAEGGIVISRHDENVEKTSKILRLPPIPVVDLETIRGKDIVQIMAFGTETERNAADLFNKVLPHCRPQSWNPYFYDITPATSDKATGIDMMIRHFNIPLEQTMAFGDGDNDIGMLEHVAIGVAMGNAAENVKRAGDYVTDPIDCNGVINALLHFNIL